MKILMINHFPLEGSGSGTYTKNIATSLAKLGHEVHIVMPENKADYPRIDGVTLHPVFFTPEDGSPAPDENALPFNFPCFTTHPRSTMTFSELSEDELSLYLLLFAIALQDEIDSFHPDIIHGQHVWVLPSLVSECKIPLVLTAHGTDLMGYEKWPEFRPYAESAMDAASAVITISKDSSSLVEKTFPNYADKAIFMRNGYNSGIFFPRRHKAHEVLSRYGVSVGNEHVVLFAGKLTHFKGVDIALRAAALYECSTTRTITVIAGDGTEREMLETLASDLNLKSVHFIGNVSQEELAELYDIADVSLVPSRREPFGLVAIEAMACGTPVVASDEGGLPDFVNDEVGRLVAPEDPRALAAAVIDTLRQADNDLDWHKRITAYAKDNYSQDTIIQELISVYEKAISG